mgnify:CR=1 FL=1
MSPLVVTPQERFDEIPADYQQFAQSRILNRAFSSLDEILAQTDHNGHPAWHYFFIGEKTIKPQNLPAVVNEVDLVARFTRRGAYEASHIKALTVRYVDDAAAMGNK